MARPLRTEFPGAVYYITSRGIDNRKVFLDKYDPEEWLEIFGTVCKRYNWKVYAYCLMPDNYQIVAETISPSLSIGMRQLNGIYTQNFNTRHNNHGNIFRGRFKSVHIQKEKFLDQVVKNVLGSPVRAGFVKYPYQYKFSSCRFLRDSSACPDWLDTVSLSYELAGELTGSEYERDTASENIFNNVRMQIFLGDDQFIDWISNYNEPDNEDDNELSDLKRFVAESNSRDEAITNAYLSGNYSMKEIGEYFSLHYSTVSRIIKNFENDK